MVSRSGQNRTEGSARGAKMDELGNSQNNIIGLKWVNIRTY